MKMNGMIAYPRPEKEQLEQYAQAFYGLSKLFQRMPCQRARLDDTELERLFGEVRGNVCGDCAYQQRCWEEEYFQSSRVLYELLSDLEYNGSVSQATREQLRGRCTRAEQVEQTCHTCYGQARVELMWNNRMMEQRTAVGEQIFQTAELLQKTARHFEGAPEREIQLQKKLKRKMHSFGVELESVRIFLRDDAKEEVYLTLRCGKKVCVSARTIAELLSECSRERMCPAWDCRAAVSEHPANFHFVPDTRYQMFCGISRITKAGELISGDNYAFLQKDTGKVVMSLADGMGSGAQACRESETVIELLEQFLDAGFPQETAVRMINSCMLLQNQQGRFSTIDLCMVDLYDAGCDLIKSGAASTYLFDGKEIEVIDSGSFPAGVMQQSDYESMHRQLKSGSSVIMMTDGVLEALPGDDRERQMAELIGRCASRNAREYARRLMEKVYLMQKLRARDDMTILVGTIWEK
jgi:stage II sporulation protein E